MITTNTSGNPISAGFIDEIRSDSPNTIARLWYNGAELSCDIVSITVEKGSCGSDPFMIGEVVGDMLKATVKNLSDIIKGETIECHIGAMVSGSYEYISLGKFKVSEVKKTRYQSEITAYSGIVADSGGDFDALSLTDPTIATLAIRLQSDLNCTISFDSSIDTTQVIKAQLKGLTDYQALQVLAICCGGYAINSNDGNIVIKRYDATPTLNVDTGMMVKLPEIAEKPYEINKIGVLVAPSTEDYEGAEVPEIYYTTDTTDNLDDLYFECAYMTSDIFSANIAPIVGYAYYPATIGLTLGDPRLEGSDVLSVLELDGNTYAVPCHNIVHKYTGGFSTQIKSADASETANDIGSTAPITQRLNAMERQTRNAQVIAEDAYNIADNTNQYFWFEGIGTDTGAHITEIPQEVWKDQSSPYYHAGGNLLARSNGIAVRDGMTEVSTFSEKGVRIGRDNGYKTFVGADGLSWGIFQGELFKLGWSEDKIVSVTGDQEAWSPVQTNQSKDFDWMALVPIGTVIRITANGHDADIVAGVASTNDYLVYDGLETIVNRVTGDYLIRQPSYSYAPPNMHLGKPNDEEHRIGCYSAELGEGVIANSDNQLAIGKYNVVDTYDSSTPDGDYILILGNGSRSSRSNAFAVKRNGIINAENVLTYGECDTASATVAKEVTVAFGSFTLQTGATIAVKFTYANTASNPTLNVNGTGAKAIMRYGTTAGGTSAGASWQAGSVVSFLYDGTYWQMIGFNNTTYSGMSDAEYQAGTGTTNRLITPARLVNAIKYWAVALTDKYTRSSVGNLDWSNQTDGDAKVIAKSALAFWNGAYSGTASNLAYCNKGAFGTLATKNSLSASDVGAVPTSRKVNNKALSSDISLTAGDVGAVARSAVCYANSRVDNFVNGQITLSLSSLGITTGAKPVGILLTYQDGGATPTILRYDYDASSASGVVIKAYNSSGGAVSGNVRYFAMVFQNSWTSVS